MRLKDSLQREVGEGENKKNLEDHVVDTVIRKALKGDFQMIKLIWAYRDGKPPKWKGNDESNTEPHRRKGLRNDDGELERVMKLLAPKDKPAQS